MCPFDDFLVQFKYQCVYYRECTLKPEEMEVNASNGDAFCQQVMNRLFFGHSFDESLTQNPLTYLL